MLAVVGAKLRASQRHLVEENVSLNASSHYETVHGGAVHLDRKFEVGIAFALEHGIDVQIDFHDTDIFISGSSDDRLFCYSNGTETEMDEGDIRRLRETCKLVAGPGSDTDV